MVVDKVAMALQQSFHGSDTPDQLMSDSEENDGCSSESEESLDSMEPEDTMTLTQYQSNHRKETLSRKSVQSPMSSQKKGRVVIEKGVL